MNFIKKIIDDWDPAEKNQRDSHYEYQIEIKRTKKLLYSTDDFNKLSEGIYEIFVRQFGFKKSKLECEQIAQMLLSQKIVKKIIDDWDPIDLFPGAPNDEYWTEIEEIDQVFRVTDNPIKLSEGIHRIFVKSFGEDTFKRSIADCEPIAQMLLSQKK